MKTSILRQLALIPTLFALIVHASLPLWQETIERASRLVGDGQFVEAEQLLLPLAAGGADAKPGIIRAVALNNLASLYQDQGNYRKAERAYLDCLAEWQRLDPSNEQPLAHPMNNLASLYSIQGRYSRAEVLYRHSLRIRMAIHGAGSPEVARLHNNLGVQLRRQGRLDDAQREFERSAAIWEPRGDTDYFGRATLLNNMAHVAELKQEYERAETLYRRALTIWEANGQSQLADAAIVNVGLGRTLALTGRLKEAESLLSAARATLEARLGASHTNVAAAVDAQALLYRKMKRKNEAKELEQQARAIQARSQLGFTGHSVDWTDLKEQ